MTLRGAADRCGAGRATLDAVGVGVVESESEGARVRRVAIALRRAGHRAEALGDTGAIGQPRAAETRQSRINAIGIGDAGLAEVRLLGAARPTRPRRATFAAVVDDTAAGRAARAVERRAEVRVARPGVVRSRAARLIG